MLTTSQESKTQQRTDCRVDFNPRGPSRLYFGPRILTMPSSMDWQVQMKIGLVVPHISLRPEYSFDAQPLVILPLCFEAKISQRSWNRRNESTLDAADLEC